MRVLFTGVMLWELGQDDVSGAPGSAPLLPEIANIAALASASGWQPGKLLEASSVQEMLRRRDSDMSEELLALAEKQRLGGPKAEL